jgi:transketolase
MSAIKKTDIRMYSLLGSCGVFGMAMNDLAEEDGNLAVVTADLCNYSGLERFSRRYPHLLYNVGIAEQNMVGVASGMAKEGLNVFASTYASFATTRALDQVKVSLGYMRLPVKLVGLTSGYSVGILGATHVALEDISIIRSIPNIVLLSPADGLETYKMIMLASKLKEPVYIRLSGTMNNPVVYNEDFELEIGKAIELKSDGDVAVIATGTMVYQCKEAIEILRSEGIQCSLYDFHTIKPLDYDCINVIAKKSRVIVTVEEHFIYGGLGSAVAEALASKQNRPPQLILGVKDKYFHAASYEHLLENNHLDVDGIANNIRKFQEENT